MIQENGRAWIAQCRWPGAKRPFWFGTVFCRLNATHQELEAAVLRDLAEILPANVPAPEIVQLMPGQLVILPEQEGPVA